MTSPTHRKQEGNRGGACRLSHGEKVSFLVRIFCDSCAHDAHVCAAYYLLYVQISSMYLLYVQKKPYLPKISTVIYTTRKNLRLE